jgi:endonuclease/exonuclease/phosphatase (EEP) superfamily protein YafD
LAALPALLAELPPMRVVLGDANATPWNASFGAMLAATGLELANVGSWFASWPGGLPWFLRIPIDHVLVSDAIGVHRVTLCGSVGSDHLPLVAEVGPRER